MSISCVWTIIYLPLMIFISFRTTADSQQNHSRLNECHSTNHSQELFNRPIVVWHFVNLFHWKFNLNESIKLAGPTKAPARHSISYAGMELSIWYGKKCNIYMSHSKLIKMSCYIFCHFSGCPHGDGMIGIHGSFSHPQSTPATWEFCGEKTALMHFAEYKLIT